MWIKRLIDRIKKWFSGCWRSSREENILVQCGCVCYCPNCKDPLNDQADWDDELNEYKCNKCGCKSVWDFDSAPAPLLKSWTANPKEHSND